jgi:ubiquinone/menaquinone biosynthesis C-methylase UbiE
MNDAYRLDLQMHYWNAVGPTKPCAHPVNIAQLRRWVAPGSRILDYGCGYGRVLGILNDNGYTNLIGVDPAPAMIAAARRSFPSIAFDVLSDYQKLDLPDGSVDAVLLFTVLTCVPTDEGQCAIIAEITRVLRSGGVLYISDMFLQTDSRNLERYVQGEKKYGIYGVFDLREGVTVRHHDRAWIETLTKGYDSLLLEEIAVQTMNGHPATAFQWFGLLSQKISRCDTPRSR